MKNICFLNTTTFWGGGEKLYYDYALKFKERGYRVLLAAAKDCPLQQRASKAGLQTFSIHFGNLSFLNPFKYFRFIAFLRREKIDTLIMSSSPDLKVGAIAARYAGVKNIVFYKALAKPVKNTLLNRYLYSKALTQIIANSMATRKVTVQNMQKLLHEADIEIAYHGLEIAKTDQQEVKSLWKKEDGIVYIGNAGRLTEQKGQQYLIEIARRLKERKLKFKIVIAGSGELETELKNKIESNNLKNEILLLGFVEDVNSFMHGIDIFALTSTWEGFGYVLAEAMLAKKPLIGFNLSSNPELIAQEKNGFLIEFCDLNIFSEKIALLINNPELRTQLGNEGRKILEERFDLDKVITDFENCILKRETHSLRS